MRFHGKKCTSERALLRECVYENCENVFFFFNFQARLIAGIVALVNETGKKLKTEFSYLYYIREKFLRRDEVIYGAVYQARGTRH